MIKYYNARVLFRTGRLAEAENLLRPILEERPGEWNVWTLLVEVVLAKGDREEAVRISNHVGELPWPKWQPAGPDNQTFSRAMILMHLGDRAGAVEFLRPIFGPQRRPLQALMRLHRIQALMRLHRTAHVPQSMANYAPFQELVGWPPPLPN